MSGSSPHIKARTCYLRRGPMCVPWTRMFLMCWCLAGQGQLPASSRRNCLSSGCLGVMGFCLLFVTLLLTTGIDLEGPASELSPCLLQVAGACLGEGFSHRYLNLSNCSFLGWVGVARVSVSCQISLKPSDPRENPRSCLLYCSDPP